nr:ribonuclease H-like domain-containing protein [Tanacetum cinerariifolium]
MTPRAVLMKTGLRPLNTARHVNTTYPKSHPQKEDQCYVDSGCSRHMIGNMSYLFDFKEFDEGYVTFGRGAKGGKITGKGTLKTGKLDFKDVYFVKQLQFNLFRVSQMSDKKNSVLFTDTGCFILSPKPKLTDESQVLLKVPKKKNMYSIDMKNIVLKESLTCFVTKATLDESMLWHKRLGHINFKNINKLVKDNLVRGLPLKRFENDHTCAACLKGKQHKASCKSKIHNSITQPLFMLHMDLFVLSFMCDKKNSVLFNDRCFVLSPDFKLPDESQVLLKVPRKNNMYSVDMKNIVPKESLTCLVAKATLNESILWHRRLATKDETTGNVTEFKNSVMNDFCEMKDHLEKFDGKSDNEFFVGYSLNSKAFRVYDIRTRKVEENLHISTNVNTGSLNINTVSPSITTASLEATYADLFGEEIEVDMSNISTTYLVPSTTYTRIYKDHSLDYMIGDVQSGIQTRRMTKTISKQGFISDVYKGKTHKDLHTCLFACFLSQEEPKMVWTLMDLPYGKRAAIGTKWIHKNKKNKRGIVVGNKARIKAMRLFLAYASFKDFLVYQMYVKSTFLYGKIEEEVYVCQPSRFEDPEFLIELISQDKYVDEILKKFGFSTVKTARTPMETSKPLLKDAEAEDVNVHLYRSMIGSLMYLTTSRPDIIIFRYLNGQPKLGLWYSKDSPFYLEAYTDSGYASASLDKKSTTSGCQFLRSRLISWQCKKQTVVANSTTEVEYIAAASCCGQTVTVRIVDNGEQEITATVDGKEFTTATVRIVDNGEQEITATVDGKEFTVTEASARIHLQLADADDISVLPNTKFFDQLSLMGQALNKVTELPQTSDPIPNVANEAVYEEWDDKVERAATIAASLDVEQGSGFSPRCQEAMGGSIAQTRSERSNDPPLSRGHTLGSGEDSIELIKELMETCTKLFERVLALEESETAQDLVITRLKLRVKKMEKKKKKARTPHHIKMRLFKVRVESFAEENWMRRILPNTGGELYEEERQRMARVHEATQYFTEEEWENIKARVEADEKLAQRLQAKEKNKYSEVDQAKILNMGSYTLNQLKKLSFDEIKKLFETTMKIVNTFVPMETEVRGRASELAAGSLQVTITDSAEVGNSKRVAEAELDYEGSKRQKTNETSGLVREQPDKRKMNCYNRIYNKW